MSIYDVRVEETPKSLRNKIHVFENTESFQKSIAIEFADLLESSQKENRILTIICPVGPLDYSYFAKEVKARNLSCKNLRTVNMDEYLDESDKLIPLNHPLSFRRFMEETFFSNLDKDKRPLQENIIFPSPDNPEKVTELIDKIDGADICWAGFGITGHVAFNDPPSMNGEPTDMNSFKKCKTRKLTICPMASAQMAMGGTNGNFEILPKRAVTVGMYEMLKSKKMHLTFMRNWHAGLWRRALLGPITTQFPGSLIQEHPNFTVSMTKLAATLPLVNTSQETGDEK